MNQERCLELIKEIEEMKEKIIMLEDKEELRWINAGNYQAIITGETDYSYMFSREYMNNLIGLIQSKPEDKVTRNGLYGVGTIGDFYDVTRFVDDNIPWFVEEYDVDSSKSVFDDIMSAKDMLESKALSNKLYGMYDESITEYSIKSMNTKHPDFKILKSRDIKIAPSSRTQKQHDSIIKFNKRSKVRNVKNII